MKITRIAEKGCFIANLAVKEGYKLSGHSDVLMLDEIYHHQRRQSLGGELCRVGVTGPTSGASEEAPTQPTIDADAAVLSA